MKISIQVIAATYLVATFGASVTASVPTTTALSLTQSSSGMQSASSAAIEQLRTQESMLIASRKYNKNNCFKKCTEISCMYECGPELKPKSISENNDSEIISTKTVRDVFEELQIEISDLKS